MRVRLDNMTTAIDELFESVDFSITDELARHEREEAHQNELAKCAETPTEALAVEDDEILERRHPTRFWAGWDPSLDPLVGYSYVTDPHIPAMPAET